MKRFLLFAGSNYYPLGGWRDFVKDFDTLDEAKEYVASVPEITDYFTWYHICDTKHNEIVIGRK